MIKDDQGNYINPEGWPHSFTYDGAGQLLTDSFSDGTFTWTQTYTWSGSNLTAISAWVRT